MIARSSFLARPSWISGLVWAAIGWFNLGLACPVVGQEYGTLKGRFVFDGRAPKPASIVVNKDQAVCGPAGLVDETIAVGADGGLANVVLWVDDSVKPHPDFADPSKLPPAVMDNDKCRFAPRITTAMTGQTVVLKNSDSVRHFYKWTMRENSPVGLLVPGAARQLRVFDHVEPLPISVECNIHPWMKGYLIVKDHPYAAGSGDDGTFTIEKIPAGKYTFILWHESAGFLKSVTVGGKAQKLSRGKFEIETKPGENDLGDIKIPGEDLACDR